MKKISCNNNVNNRKAKRDIRELKKIKSDSKQWGSVKLVSWKCKMYLDFIWDLLKIKKKLILLILPVSWNSATEDKFRAKPSTTSKIFLAYHQTIQFIHTDIQIEKILEQLKPRERKTAVMLVPPHCLTKWHEFSTNNGATKIISHTTASDLSVFTWTSRDVWLKRRQSILRKLFNI